MSLEMRRVGRASTTIIVVVTVVVIVVETAACASFEQVVVLEVVWAVACGLYCSMLEPGDCSAAWPGIMEEDTAAVFPVAAFIMVMD